MKLTADFYGIKAIIILMLAMGISLGLNAETKYSTSTNEGRIMPTLQSRLLKPCRNTGTKVEAPRRNNNRTHAGATDDLRGTLDTVWVKEYHGPGGGDAYPWPHCIAVDDSGNVYVAGASYGIGTARDYTIIKYDRDGNEKWTSRYDLNGGEDIIHAMALDDSGYIYATGMCGPLSGNAMTTIKYDANGDTLWVRGHVGSGGFMNYGNAIMVDDSENVYVTGFETGVSIDGNCITIKYDKNGNPIWQAVYDTPGTDMDLAEGMDIAMDNTGNVYVGGYYTPDLGYTDYMMIKYNPAGETLWCRIWDGGNSDWDYGEHVMVDEMGNSYMTGAANFYETTTLKYDAYGNQQWVNYGGGYYPLDFTRDASGNILVTSYSDTYNGSPWVTIKYDTAGNCVWNMPYADGKRPWDMTADDFGNIYVTGSGTGPVCEDEYHTMKYDSSGTELWLVTYNGYSWYNAGFAVAVDDSGCIYVTGEVDENYGGDGSITTIKYRELPTAVAENKNLDAAKNSLRISNPVIDRVIVYFPEDYTGNANFTLHDVSGRSIKTQNAKEIHNRQCAVDLSDLNSGVYFLNVATELGSRTLKLIKIK